MILSILGPQSVMQPPPCFMLPNPDYGLISAEPCQGWPLVSWRAGRAWSTAEGFRSPWEQRSAACSGLLIAGLPNTSGFVGARSSETTCQAQTCHAGLNEWVLQDSGVPAVKHGRSHSIPALFHGLNTTYLYMYLVVCLFCDPVYTQTL